jgi:hypothetical protein
LEKKFQDWVDADSTHDPNNPAIAIRRPRVDLWLRKFKGNWDSLE